MYTRDTEAQVTKPTNK